MNFQGDCVCDCLIIIIKIEFQLIEDNKLKSIIVNESVI